MERRHCIHVAMILCCAFPHLVAGINMAFNPAALDELKEEHDYVIEFNYTSNTSSLIYVMVAHPYMAQVIDPVNATMWLNSTLNTSISGADNQTLSTNHSIKVRGLFLGRTTLKFYISDVDSRRLNLNSTTVDDGVVPLDGVWRELPMSYKLAVVRDNHVVDGMFTLTVIVIVFLASISIGCKMDLAVVKEVLKKPISPAIGLASQFVIMPLIGYGVAKALQMEGSLGLGLFAMACAPGGGASNMYTILLDADLDLSVTMTLISTILSLGMVPLWLFTLGQHEFVNSQDYTITIPYQNVMYSLVSVVISVGIGLLIKYKRPTWAAKLTRFMKPCFLLFLLVIFTFGVWANLYIFTIFRNQPLNLLAGCLLPWCGFLFGGIFAWICRQDFKRIKTIAIETGIQNSGVPIILMKVSLPQPDADISIAPPVAASCFTPIPLLIAVIIHVLYHRYKKKDPEDKKYTEVHLGNGDTSGDMSLEKVVDEEGNVVEKKQPLEDGAQSDHKTDGHNL